MVGVIWKKFLNAGFANGMVGQSSLQTIILSSFQK